MSSSPNAEARRKRVEALRQKHQSRRSINVHEEETYDGNNKKPSKYDNDVEKGAINNASVDEDSSKDESSSLSPSPSQQVEAKQSKKRFSPGIERGLAALVSRTKPKDEEEFDDPEEAHVRTSSKRRKKHRRSSDPEEVPPRSLSNRKNISPRATPEDSTLFDQQDAQEQREVNMDRIRGGAASLSLLIQGILAGICIQTLFDGIPTQQPADFILQYAHQANAIRRFYFLAITMCLSCSLCLVVPPRESIITGTSKEMIGTLPEGLLRWWWSIVACYGTALILTLPIAVVDVQLFTILKEIQDQDLGTMVVSALDSYIDIPNIRVWRALSIIRSICCIAAWCLVCQQQYRAYQRRREIMSWYN